MPNLEFATGTVALPVWAVGAAAVLFVCIGVLTLTRAGAGVAGALLRVATVIVAFAAVWFWFDQTSLHERAAERRALDQRVSDLNARSVAPGSALACLDANAGETVEAACEKAVFATPQSVAEAVSYVSARLTLLADATDFARRTGANYASAIAALRLAIETDRYGLVAHVLSVRDSCTPLLCDSYVLLHDPDRVQANLRERLFDRYVDRYTSQWVAQAAGTPNAEAAPNAYASAAVPTPAPAQVPSKFDFPTAASIPPVSIMTPEPGAPESKPDAKTEPKPEAKSESKSASGAAHHPPRSAPARATARATPPPQQITPPSAATAGPALR